MAAVARRGKEWMASVFCQQCWVLLAHVADKALELARLHKMGRRFVSKSFFNSIQNTLIIPQGEI